MANNAPIGVFDSGLGGLSVLKNIHLQMPTENLIYLADSHYVPYGEKDTAFLIERCLKITDFFITLPTKAMVIACNTATVAAANILREKYPNYPIIAIEPAIKPAAQATRTGKIGVLATTSTLNSTRFAQLTARYAAQVEVYPQPCPGLVEYIEKGELTGEGISQLLSSYLTPLLDKGCDTIILGCTHYPFLSPLLKRMLPPAIKVIEAGIAVTKRLEHVLTMTHNKTDTLNQASVAMYTTGDLTNFTQSLSILWPTPIASIQGISL